MQVNGETLQQVRTERMSIRYWDDAVEEVSSLGEADDTPMYGFPLGFEFPFLSKSRRVAFVNPNGALTFRPAPPCQSYFGQSGACTTNSSWFGLIAILVTDLDPSAHGTISVGGNDSIVVRYENVSYYGATREHPTVTIGSRIHRDGLVEIFHEQVDEARGGLVGIRFDDPDDDDMANGFSSNRVLSTQAQLDRMKFWSTEVAGAYAGSEPVDNTRVVACPVPEDWCVEIVDETSFDLEAPFFGCSQEFIAFNFRCVLVASDRHIVASDTSLVSLEHKNGLRCDFSSASLNGSSIHDLLSSEYSVKIWYDAPTGDRDGGAGDGGSETVVLGLRQLVTNEIGLCDVTNSSTAEHHSANETACNLYQASYFSRADCRGCPSNSTSTFDEEDAAAVTFFTSNDEVCCDWRDVDCLGSCTGNAYPRLLTVDADGRDHDFVVCQCDEFDCAGTCGGHAVRDECQVCGGNGTSKDVCGVCGGTAQNASLCIFQPPQPTKAPTRRPGEYKKHRTKSSSDGFLANLNNHPWIILIVALEVCVSIACFKSCALRRAAFERVERATNRRIRRRRHSTSSEAGGESSPSSATLTQSDLDDLVHSSLSPETEEMFYVAHGVSAGTRRNTALNGGVGVGGMRRFVRRSTSVDASLDDVRARVAEAYASAVASLCAMPTENGDGEDAKADDAVCAICLDPLRDDATRPVKLPNCGHEFHRDCILHWLTSHNSCPYCKSRAVERVEPATSSNSVVRLRVLSEASESMTSMTTGDAPEADSEPSAPSSRDVQPVRDIEMHVLNTAATDEEEGAVAHE